MGFITLLIFLVIIPGTIGIAVNKILDFKGSQIWIAAIPMGFFLEISLFQFIAFPWAVINLSFSSLCIVFICLIVICAFFSVLYIKKANYKIFRLPSFRSWDIFYGIIAVLLIGWQVYNMVYLDIGFWSSDDATYGAMANDALTYNTLFRNDVSTGIALVLYIQRAMQSSVVYPAFLSFVSGFSVASVHHTILGVYYLLLAYSVYFFLGRVLFKNKENIFVFIIIISILYIFGLYTMYSQTYRLLGPSTQGKAVLAVSFFPFLYSLMIIKLTEKYDGRFGLFLMLLSVAASSMTLFGTITMIGNVVFPVVISLIRKNRNWKNLRYILWGCLCPVVYCCIYFYSSYMP